MVILCLPPQTTFPSNPGKNCIISLVGHAVISDGLYVWTGITWKKLEQD